MRTRRLAIVAVGNLHSRSRLSSTYSLSWKFMQLTLGSSL